MQKIIYLVIIITFITLIYFYFSRKNTKTIIQKISNQNYSLEIANNPYLQAKGLSNRNYLCPNCGMLFIFSHETIQTFWMKDTLIPLDMIFINSQGQITDIYTAFPENKKSDFELTLYQSSTPSKFVIELNSGDAQKLNLKKADYLKLNL